tara:strand:+ start:269 stop:484 length:216 start_codon:yes stop_codon:yes gene_type:complete
MVKIDMDDDQLKQHLRKLKAEQKAKSKRDDQFKSLFSTNSNKFEDKLTAIRVTHKADGGLFTSAIKKMMKN